MSINILDLVLEKDAKRQKLLLDLLKIQEMIRGTFRTVHVKCGKKNCHCRSGEGHLHQRMALHKDGKGFQRAVPREDRAWAREMAGNYHNFRAIRKEISTLDKEIKSLLDSYEELVTNESKKDKKYLDV